MGKWKNEDIKALLETEIDVVETIRRCQLSYFGHVSRMKPERIPAQNMNGWIHGSRPRRRPRKKWLDEIIKEDCEERGVSFTQA